MTDTWRTRHYKELDEDDLTQLSDDLYAAWYRVVGCVNDGDTVTAAWHLKDYATELLALAEHLSDSEGDPPSHQSRQLTNIERHFWRSTFHLTVDIRKVLKQHTEGKPST